MKKVLFLALLAIAVWQASKHWGDLFEKKPAHEAVVVNDGSRPLERIRLRVAGQTFVRERLDPGAQAVFRFQVSRDETFELWWEIGIDDHSWKGGFVARGPMVERHTLRIHDDGSVFYTVVGIDTP